LRIYQRRGSRKPKLEQKTCRDSLHTGYLTIHGRRKVTGMVDGRMWS